jgi:hypothetical protein
MLCVNPQNEDDMLLIALLVLSQPDPCSWLTSADFTKALGQTVAASGQSAAPPAYHGQNPGKKCEYGTGRPSVELIVYVDNSPTEAKTTFERLTMFYPATSHPSGLGDEAYIDKTHAIHVLKGRTRFYIQVSSSGPKAQVDQQAQDLAKAVLAKL